MKRIVSLLIALFVTFEAKASISDNFTGSSLSPATWQVDTGYSNGAPFNCEWWASQVSVGNSILTLSIKPQAGQPPYAAGEVKSRAFNGHGVYTVNMKPSNAIGVVSSFFVYTGPSYGAQWNEIDIEFAHFNGGLVTGIQFNYFVNGVGGHEVVYPLPFDPSAAYHTYAFDYEPTFIAWYIDGVKVYQTPAGAPIPAATMKIFMNIWPPIGIDAWVGGYQGAPTSASYDWVTFVPNSKH